MRYSPVEESFLLPSWKTLSLVFLPSLTAFIAMDMAWISFAAGSMYQEVLGDLLRPQPSALAGLLAWCCIVAAVQHFAVGGAAGVTRNSSGGAAFVNGWLLGCALYGCYEFTNYAVILTWTWQLAVADVAWGSFACGVAAMLQHHLYSRQLNS